MTNTLSRRVFLAGASLLATAGAALAAAATKIVKGDDIKVSDDLVKAIGNARRPEDDRKRDADRKPAQLMSFFGVKPGMKVADLAASRGYFTAVLAEAVGPTGTVYGQNNKALLSFSKDAHPLANLIDKQGYKNIVKLDSEMDDPKLPSGLDGAFMIMFYHDLFNPAFKADRDKMNKAILAALKPGGVYGIVDHHAAPGMGTTDTNKNHRVERYVVVEEVLKAGFILAEETDLLENMKDPLNVSMRAPDLRGKTHQFVLKFKKPA